MKPTTITIVIVLLLTLNSCSSSASTPSSAPTLKLVATQTEVFKDMQATTTKTPTHVPTSTRTYTPTVPPQIIDAKSVRNVKLMYSINVPDPGVSALYWSSDSKRLLVHTCQSNPQSSTLNNCYEQGNNALTVINPFTGKMIRQVPVDILGIGPRLFSGNGRFISVVDNFAPYNWKGYFLDVDTGQRVGALNPSILGINDSGDIVIADEGYGLFSAQLSSNNTIQTLETIPNNFYINQGVFSRDGLLYAQPGYTNGNQYLIQIWDTPSGKALSTISSLYLPPRKLSFTADGSNLVGYFVDQGIPRVDVWDSMTGQIVHSIKWEWPMEFTNPLPSISPDGRLLAIPNVEIVQNRPNIVIQILNIENREILTSIPTPKNTSGAIITFSGDGRWLAYASRVENNSNQWQIYILAVTP
jgi:WD40 repeat protein